jgi:threonine dehydrogenase-like Zn-dependent dehydrogenase
MQQLTFLSPGKFEWHDVPAPALQSDTDAIVAPVAVARCDLDLYIATGVVAYPGPFAFGHESIGRVVDAGPAASVVPGDLVAVPFQLSCGRCRNCQRGHTNACLAYPLGAAYGLKPTSKTEFGGALADLMYVPYADHMLVKLAPGVDPVAAASLTDNIADGWRAVAGPLRDCPGGSVLVVGGLARSVGLYAAGAAVSLGAGRVLYLDDDATQRSIATSLGALAAPLSPLESHSPGDVFDIVVEAAGFADALTFAVNACAPNGYLTSVAIHFGNKTPMPLTAAYYRGLTFHTSRVHSRATFPDAMACIACGKLHPEKVTSRVVTFGEAAEAMADPGPKIVFTR